MILTYGICTADPKRLDKRPYYTQLHTATISAKKTIAENQPYIIIAATADNTDTDRCNYAVLDGMYYTIADVDKLTGARYGLRLVLDDLTSYADYIMQIDTTITRQQGIRQPMLSDPAYTKKSNIQVETIQFNRSPFVVNYATDFCYVMSVIGGANT